jgi:hypothetical protein
MWIDHWTRRCRAVHALIVLCVMAPAALLPASAAQTIRKSGYALTDEKCGEGARAYPKLRIGMRDGYCAGLVASKQDGLIFPRSIVQIPISVNSSSRTWVAGIPARAGCCCSIRMRRKTSGSPL